MDTAAAVDAFVAALDHPCKDVVIELRTVMCACDPSIAEGVKWNAPSFRTREYFATINLREKLGVGVILHLGAKVRAQPAGGLLIEDPAQLLNWLAKDRAAVVFKDLTDLEEKKLPFARIIQRWIGSALD